MKRKAIMMLLLAFLCVGSGTQKCLSGLAVPSVVIEAEASGVEHIWDNMDIDNTGTFNPGVANEAGKAEDMGNMLERYKVLVLTFTGFLTLTCIALVIFNISKLAMAGSNEQARKNAIIGIMVSGIALGLFGGASIVIGFFWNAFNS